MIIQPKKEKRFLIYLFLCRFHVTKYNSNVQVSSKRQSRSINPTNCVQKFLTEKKKEDKTLSVKREVTLRKKTR